MASEASSDAMATVAEKAPITAERKVRGDLDAKLPKPCKFIFILICIRCIWMSCACVVFEFDIYMQCISCILYMDLRYASSNGGT